MRFLMMYLAVGVLLAAFLDLRQHAATRRERLGTALLTLAAWPLSAPLALLPSINAPAALESAALRRIRSALDEARVAVVGTALESLLPEALVTQLFATLIHVEKRHTELGALLSRPDFQSSPESATRLQQDSVRRLRQLYERDQALLWEMVELSEALRTQLIVARYSGQGEDLGPTPGAHSGHSVRELALDLAARVESLSAWFELDTDSLSVDTVPSA